MDINTEYFIPTVLFLFLGIFCKTFHGHYLDRKLNHDKAVLYLSSDVCKNSELRVKLGTYARCSISEKELSISPFLHSVYDVLEDYWICGHDKCNALGQWVVYNKTLIAVVLCFLLYLIYQYYMWNKYVANTRSENLILPVRGFNRMNSFVEFQEFPEDNNDDFFRSQTI